MGAPQKVVSHGHFHVPTPSFGGLNPRLARRRGLVGNRDRRKRCGSAPLAFRHVQAAPHHDDHHHHHHHPVVTPVIKTNYGGLYGATDADRSRRGVNQLWLKVNWSDLNPGQGVYNWTPITNTLAANTSLVIRLHVKGGPSTPGWLKTSAGTVQVSNAKDGITTTVGKYWTSSTWRPTSSS